MCLAMFVLMFYNKKQAVLNAKKIAKRLIALKMFNKIVDF